VRPVVLPDLQELCYGRWQGLDAAARERDDRALGERWRERSWSVRFPGGESLDDVDRRAARVLAGHPGGTVLLCAHGHFNRVLLLRALGWQRDRFWSVEQPNGCCYVLDVLGRASLASILTLDGRDE
jgi:broad specificity phosphatase PhoE